MKPIKLTIQANAYDCYVYGGYVFFIMRDGRIMYGSYPKIISILQHKYSEFSGFIKIAFLRNDHYHSNAAKAFLQIPSVKDCLVRDWDRLSQHFDFRLEFEEIEDDLDTLCTLPSTPLDTKIYGMRLFVGCVDGMYEVQLRPDRYRLNPLKIERCFDGKVIHLNAKYGEVVLSLGMDGMVAESIDIDGDDATIIHDNNVIAEKSNKTAWADSDIMNYKTPSEFSYFHNVTMERKRTGQKKYWEKIETRQIIDFGKKQFPMDELISKSGLKKEDILSSFNSQEKSFIQLKNGSIVAYNFKDEKDENKEFLSPYLSSKGIKISKTENVKSLGRMITGTTVPKGCAVEFFDKVVLFQNSNMQVIEDEEVMKVRSFMNTYRYQDILSVTKMDSITLHALDTLDISREIKTYRRQKQNLDLEDFDKEMDPEILSLIKGEDTEPSDNDSDLPW
jgi:hypothetical protein